MWAVGRGRRSRWSARSAARTNDLDVGKVDRMLNWGRRGLRVSSHCVASGGVTWLWDLPIGAHAGAQTYLGPRTKSGDMMMDRVPGVRAVRSAAAQSFRDAGPEDGDSAS
jgi:hypothetical protein